MRIIGATRYPLVVDRTRHVSTLVQSVAGPSESGANRLRFFTILKSSYRTAADYSAAATRLQAPVNIPGLTPPHGGPGHRCQQLGLQPSYIRSCDTDCRHGSRKD